MKIVIRLKGGPGSGHYGHSGRPGKRGGSAGGIGVVTRYPRDMIKQEAIEARAKIADAGKGSYTLGDYSTFVTFGLSDADIENYYPKMLHNGKVAVAEVVKIGPSQVPTRIAYGYHRGLLTLEQVSEELGKPVREDYTWGDV